MSAPARPSRHPRPPIAPDRSLLLRIRAEVDEALEDPVCTAERHFASDLRAILQAGGVYE